MRRAPSTNSDLWIAATYATGIVDLVERWDVSRDALLRGVPIDAGMLAEPNGRVPVDAFLALVRRARALTGEPGLGVYLGLQMRMSIHGYVGLAAMMAGTLRETLRLAERFAPTRTTAFSFRAVVEGPEAAIVIEERADFGELRDVLLLSLAVGFWQARRAISGREVHGCARFSFDEPAYFARFASQLPSAIRFSQPTTELAFPASELDEPLPMADPAALRLMEEQCLRELEALRSGDRIVARTRDLVFAEEGARTIDEAAQALGVSGRTLKRRLAEHGRTYSGLVDEARLERATRLLRDEGLAVEEIAARVGYADPANFTRAFKRWTGESPRAWRRR